MSEDQPSTPSETFSMIMWLRIMNILVGVLFLILPGYVLFSPDLEFSKVIMYLSIVILLSGLSRMFNAFYDNSIGGYQQIARFIMGSILITLSFIIYLFQDAAQESILIVIALGLGLQGLSRFFIGLLHENFPERLKWLLMAVGALAMLISLISIIIVAIDSTAVSITITWLSIGYLLGGIARIGFGYAGQK